MNSSCLLFLFERLVWAREFGFANFFAPLFGGIGDGCIQIRVLFDEAWDVSACEPKDVVDDQDLAITFTSRTDSNCGNGEFS